MSIVRGMVAASGQNDVIAKKKILCNCIQSITIRQEQVRKGFAIISNGPLPIGIGRVNQAISFCNVT